MNMLSGPGNGLIAREPGILGRHPALAVLVLALAVPLSGCSVQNIAATSFADAMAGGGDTYAADDDIDLVGQAIPFGLKTTEGLLEELPEHRGLLLAATRGFTQYAYVYIEQPADALEDSDVDLAYAERSRARRMYLRAMRYGLRGLTVSHPEFTETVRRSPADAVSATSSEDVPLLYWTAAAWAAAISLSVDDPGLLADLPAVEAMANRALALDEPYLGGAIHVLLIRLEMSKRGVRGGAVERARRHYERAVMLSGGRQASAYVALAEAVSAAEQDKVEYERMLEQALAIDVDAKPQWRLANLVMQRRARWLLARTDLVFLE